MPSHTRPTSTRHLRLALLTNSLSPHTLPLCEALSAQVRELIAFVSAASDKFHNFPKPQASFRIVVQRSLNALRLSYAQKDYSLHEHLHLPLDTLPQLFRARPDVIISSQLGARTFFAILYRILHPRARLIIWAALSAHTEEERSGPRTLLRRWMLRFADAAFINGRSGADYLRSLGFSRPLCTVPYTIDNTLFRSSQYKPRQQQLRLLFCGRLEPSKGILQFCQTLHRWSLNNPSRRVQFTVIGDGPDRDAIHALPSLPNLSLSLLPRMDRSALPAHYKQADIFVFPSRFDEWGVVVNEAMGAGLPVLGSQFSQAVTELVQDGVNGWIFDCEDDNSIYEHLDRALNTSTSALEGMSAQALQSVSAISPDIIAQRVLQTIAEICNLPQSSIKPGYPTNLAAHPPAASIT